MPPNRQDPVRAPASVGDTACSGDRYRGCGVEHGYQGRSADLATDVPTCLPAMRDDDVDTRVHGAQPSATEPTVRASVVDHSDTRGGISPERGDAWAPEARQAARRSCRGQARWRLTANGPRNLRCRVHRSRRPNHQDAGYERRGPTPSKRIRAGQRGLLHAWMTNAGTLCRSTTMCSGRSTIRQPLCRAATSGRPATRTSGESSRCSVCRRERSVPHYG